MLFLLFLLRVLFLFLLSNITLLLDETYVSPRSVTRVLSSLNCSSAAGPGDLHYLMKTCSAALSLPYYILFVRSL